MARPTVQMPDAEKAVRVLLAELFASEITAGDVTVSIGVPVGWTSASPDHLEVAWDGTPTVAWPVSADATIRLVARAGSTSAAKALAAKAQGRLVAHMGDTTIARIRPLTGVLPARDPDTDAELASCTVRVTVRSQPIT